MSFDLVVTHKNLRICSNFAKWKHRIKIKKHTCRIKSRFSEWTVDAVEQNYLTFWNSLRTVCRFEDALTYKNIDIHVECSEEICANENNWKCGAHSEFCLNSLCQISWDWKLKLLRIFTFSIFVCRVWWWFLFYSVSYMRMAPCPMSRQWTIKTTDRRVIFTQLLSESLGSRTLRLNHSSLLFHQILVPDQ